MGVGEICINAPIVTQSSTWSVVALPDISFPRFHVLTFNSFRHTMGELIKHTRRSKAAGKIASLRAAISPEWRFNQAAKERDLTGPYIEQYSTVQEI